MASWSDGAAYLEQQRDPRTVTPLAPSRPTKTSSPTRCQTRHWRLQRSPPSIRRLRICLYPYAPRAAPCSCSAFPQPRLEPTSPPSIRPTKISSPTRCPTRRSRMQRAWMPMLSCAGHYHRDIYPRVVIFVETRKAVHLGNSRGLRLHPLRFVRVRALVELHHILIGGHDALNMLIGELDLPGQWPRRNPC